MKLNSLWNKIVSAARKTQVWLSKVFHLQLSRHVQEDHSETPPSITKTNLETYRQEIIQQGRRHMRPGESARHKVVIYSIIIGIVALLSGVGITGHLIYNSVSKSSFIYNVTSIFPVPIAVVGGQRVHHDDVLFYYQTARTIEESLDQTDDLKTDNELYVESLFKAVQNAYIQQQAHNQGLSVGDDEIASVVSNPEQLAGGAERFEASVNQVYGWSRSELERQVKIQLLRQKLLPQSVTEYQAQLEVGANPREAAEDLGLLTEEGNFVNIADLDDLPEQTPVTVVETIENMDEKVTEILPSQEGLYIVSQAGEGDGEYLFMSSEMRNQLLSQQLEAVEFYSCQDELRSVNQDIRIEPISRCLFL